MSSIFGSQGYISFASLLLSDEAASVAVAIAVAVVEEFEVVVDENNLFVRDDKVDSTDDARLADAPDVGGEGIMGQP